MTQQYEHGERVTSNEYGPGTVRYLSGDLAPDDSGERYHWPGYVCVEFDSPLPNGQPVFCWCKFSEIRRQAREEKQGC